MLFKYGIPDIYNALLEGEGADILPRLAGGDIGHILASPHFAKHINIMREYGEELAKEPITSLKYSHYRQYDETGKRGGETNRAYLTHRGRLNTFAILAMLYPNEPEYIKQLEDTIWVICDEYTWSDTAHLMPMGTDVRVPKARYDEKGLITNSSYTHTHQLDLFACETSFALCEITALLEERLAPLVVYRARTECYRRMLDPYLDLTGLWKWEKKTNNWAAVCGGSIGMTAMYLVKDPSVLTPLLLRIIAVMDAYIGDLPDDGACTEGPSYWRYGMSFFSGFADTLRKRTAGKINLFGYDKVRRIAEFKQKTYMTGNHVVSFSDSSININFRLGLSVFLSNEYDTVRVPDIKYISPPVQKGGPFRWCTDYRDLYWAKDFDFVQKAPDAKKVYLFDKAEQFVATVESGGSTYCFAVKGGYNEQPHNHNDVGSIIYHIDGDTFLAELGRGQYTKAYSLIETRYDFLCNGSHGHSLPIVNGCYQQPGREHKCTLFEVVENENSYDVRLGMEQAYGLPYLKSLTRDISFSKDGVLTLADTCEADVPISFASRFVSLNPIVVESGRVFIHGDNSSVEMVYDSDVACVSLDMSAMDIKDEADRRVTKTLDVFIVDFVSKAESKAHMTAITVVKRRGEAIGSTKYK